MKTKKSPQALAILASLIVAQTVTVPAKVLTVTRTNISGPGSLQGIVNQINAAAGDYTVEFSVSGQILLDSPLPLITNNVVFHGRPDLTISGGGRVSLFAIGSNVAATFSGMNLVNGYSTNGGAAIWNQGNLVVEGCNLSGNHGGLHGGAVYNAKDAALSLAKTTLTNNRVSPGWGAGVFSAGKLTVSSSTFVGNQSQGGDGGDGNSNKYADYGAGGGGAGFGGGLFIETGSAALTNCTFSGNTVTGGKGGTVIYGNGSGTGAGGGPEGGTGLGTKGGFGSGGSGYYLSGKYFTASGAGGFGGGDGGYGGSGIGGAIFLKSGTLQVVNCTIISNACVRGSAFHTNYLGKASGGGIYNYQGTASLLNTILELNDADNSGPDLQGSFLSAGYNIIGNNSDAKGLNANDYQNETANLGPLQPNGGPTWTHAPQEGSVAIDGGADTGAPTYDQCGTARPQGNAVDIGAVEGITESATTDSDGDGLYDADELNTYQTDPHNADTDGDGFTDGAEVRSKSDPNNPSSIPEFIQVFAAVELTAYTNTGHRYQLETSTNLTDWTPWGQPFDGVGGKTNYLVSVKNSAKAFWRISRVQ